MRLLTIGLGIATLAAPILLGAPSEARTPFQYWAQGRGVYVSSKDHPPGTLTDTLGDLVEGDTAVPPPPGSGYYPADGLPQQRGYVRRPAY